jgi:hypothetical protein
VRIVSSSLSGVFQLLRQRRIRSCCGLSARAKTYVAQAPRLKRHHGQQYLGR